MFPYPAFYVTGTDTGIGKTVTSSSLLALRCAGMACLRAVRDEAIGERLRQHRGWLAQ